MVSYVLEDFIGGPVSTTFKIYLPSVERLAASVTSKFEGPVPGGAETILVAEDSEAVCRLAKAMLERAGYTVLTAEDGRAALRIFEGHGDEIDLLLLDVVMPGLDGRAVYESIRGMRPDVRVLFSSGYSANSVHTNFILDEGMNLIEKPYQSDTLRRKVREVLDAAGKEVEDRQTAGEV